MAALERMDWEILNATADDWESLESIISLLQATVEKTPIPILVVEGGLARLTSSGLLETRPDHGQSKGPHEAWYRMTSAGRKVWRDSEFATQFN